jgi:chemotaxis protein MotB
MITLLTALFIMLYGISRVEQQKLDRFKSGVQAGLGIAGGGRSPIGVGGLPEGTRPQVVAPEVRPPAAARSAPPTPAQKIRARMEAFVQREGLGGQVSVATDPDGAVIRLQSGAMLFDPGTADLKGRTRDILEALFQAIQPEIADGSVRKVRVEGHTDDTPIRNARFPSNWQLSTTRATNVVQYLAQRHPELQTRLEAAGCANMRPVAPNATAEGRARNRRVEIRVLQESLSRR